MADFPVYRGRLPLPLRPSRLGHYALICYWVFFRPSAFKSYLYHADPSFYRKWPGWAYAARTWQHPAYRSLYLMVPGTIVLFGLLPAGLLVGLSSAVRAEPGLLGIWIPRGVTMLGVAVLLGAILGSLHGMLGVAACTIGFGVPLLLANAITTICNTPQIGQLASVTAFGIALGVVLALNSGVSGVLVGAVSFLFLPIGYLVFSQQVEITLLFVLAVLLGPMRGLFYPIHLVCALVCLCAPSRWRRHPLSWDEMVLLPLPYTSRILLRLYEHSHDRATELLADVLANPSQRWAAQRAIQHLIHSTDHPLHLLYALYSAPPLQAFVLAPISHEEWELLPTLSQVLFASIAGKRLDVWTGLSLRAEALLWKATRPLCDKRDTPITAFVTLLCNVGAQSGETSPAEALSEQAEMWQAIRTYPGGSELADVYEELADYESVAGPEAINHETKARRQEHPQVSAFRPDLAEAIFRLRQVVSRSCKASAAPGRLALNNDQVIRTLQSDLTWAMSTVRPPERALVAGIMRRWLQSMNRGSRGI